MSILDLRALATGISGSVLGVPVTVTRPAPDNTPIATTGIWSGPFDDQQPFGTDLNRLNRRRIMNILASATLTEIPRGTTIVAEERPGVSRTWRVESYATQVRPESIPVVLIPVS